ncbi:hypothetical protein DFS34DRAFT_697711 [Phlyctochytrium arcticum]|nr:hypothetical protein DFS34DRAFT_697711 [Phlyctochytrium arcticum]
MSRRGALTSKTYSLTIHGQTQKDPFGPVVINVKVDTRTTDVIESVLNTAKLAAIDQQVGVWKLYETEMISEENQRLRGYNKSEPARKLLRELLYDEYPLIIQHMWTSLPRNHTRHFFIMECIDQVTGSAGSGLFDRLRKEQCKFLSLPQLYRRLDSINRDEELAIGDLQKRYQAQRNNIQQRISELSY